MHHCVMHADVGQGLLAKVQAAQAAYTCRQRA
jgi:hypothetical protein